MSDRPTDCAGCGACCREQESPPGLVAYLPGSILGPDEGDPMDRARVATLPPHCRKELDEYVANIKAGRHPPHPRHPACLWLTPRGRCREYDRRPTICRQFELGSEACLRWRAKYPPDQGPDWMREHERRMEVMLRIVANVKREHRGQRWIGTQPCPLCGKVLHLQHHANGHVWGQCETKECLAWLM